MFYSTTGTAPTGVFRTTLGAAQLAATLSGVPFAAGGVLAFQMIASTCQEVAVHKRRAAQLVHRCASLLNSINDQTPLLVGMDAGAAFDEAEAVLRSVHRRMQKWAHLGKVQRFLKSAQIGRDLDKCKMEVDHAMERLHIANPAAMLRMQKQSMDMLQHQQATITEALEKLLINPRQIEWAVQQHKAGGDEAYELMRVGQDRLARLRQEAPVASTSTNDDQQPDQPPLSAESPYPLALVQSQLEQALFDLHKLANIPSPILVSQTRKLGSTSVRGDTTEDRWLGRKKVTLKTTRVLDGQTEQLFEPLVHLLLAARAQGIVRPLRTKIAEGLDKQAYQRVGVAKFRDYAALAERKGIIVLGGKYAEPWIALHPNWSEKDGNTTTFDSAKETKGPLSTAPDAVIETAELASSGSLSPKASDIWLQQDGAPRSPTLVQFQPLIDVLVQERAEGCHQPRRSLMGQKFDKAVYSQAGVSNFKEYCHKAAEARVVEYGGVGGFAWIRLHPELKC